MRTLGKLYLSAAIFAAGAAASPVFAAAGPLQNLPGRWSGWGSVVFDGGSKEQIKCIATYFVRDGGKQLQQNLRCTTSSSYKISAHSELSVSGRKLSGTWLERKSGNEGSVSGKITARGFSLRVRGPAFSARMLVSSTRCRQSISITPNGLGIQRIRITLGKC